MHELKAAVGALAVSTVVLLLSPFLLGLLLGPWVNRDPSGSGGLSDLILLLALQFLPIVCAVVAGAWSFARFRRPLGEQFCQKCEYDLTGNVSGVCPECGTPIKRAGRSE